MISRSEFARTLAYLERTGLPGALEQRLADAHRKPGRRRDLTVGVLFAGIMLCSQHRRTTVMTAVHKLLTTDLDHRLQRDLGIRRADGSLITVRQLRYLFTLIAGLYEHSIAYAPDLTDIERAGRADGAYAVDETAIESAARGKRNNRRASDEERRAAAGEPVVVRVADRDARWGHKTKTYENQSGLFFGFQAVTFTRLGPVGGGPPEPMLCERLALVPGNDKGIGATIDVLHGLGRAGRLPCELVVDRDFSYAAAEEWAEPLARLGVRQVFDLHKNDRGARPHPRDGYVMIDGQPYCPSIPERLIVITKPAHLSAGTLRAHPTKKERAEHAKRQADIDAFNAAIAEREQYRFAPNGRTAGGKQRWVCPARAGRVSCTGCPFSAGYPAELPRVTPDDPDNLPKACRQASIVIGDDVDAKRRQEHVWGSPQWQASVARRSRAEGTHGILKAPDTGVVRRGFTRYTGLVRTGLLLALSVAQSNLIMLVKWARATGNTQDPLTGMDTSTRGFVELDPDDEVAGGTSPPPAA